MITRLLPALIHQAQQSKIQLRLSSCIFTNTTKPQALAHNTERSMIRGVSCCAFHTEINSIMKYYGRNFRYINNRWCILREKQTTQKSKFMCNPY